MLLGWLTVEFNHITSPSLKITNQIMFIIEIVAKRISSLDRNTQLSNSGITFSISAADGLRQSVQMIIFFSSYKYSGCCCSAHQQTH